MALTKEIVPGSLTIYRDGKIGVQAVTVFIEDGKIISETYHREVLEPEEGTPKDKYEFQIVADIAAVLWTKAFVDSYKAKKAAEATDKPGKL